MLFKSIIFSSLLALASAASMNPNWARDLEARQGACGECPEGTSCHPYGGLMKCQPVAEKRAAMCGECPEGQTCQQYGEMGGIFRCQ